jgi:hypothetical protein
MFMAESISERLERLNAILVSLLPQKEGQLMARNFFFGLRQLNWRPRESSWEPAVALDNAETVTS